MAEFTVNLAAARVNAGFNQKEWADLLGISNSTVVKWEKGKTAPDSRQLRTISELSGIPMDAIFVGKKFTKSV